MRAELESKKSPILVCDPQTLPGLSKSISWHFQREGEEEQAFTEYLITVEAFTDNGTKPQGGMWHVAGEGWRGRAVVASSFC